MLEAFFLSIHIEYYLNKMWEHHSGFAGASHSITLVTGKDACERQGEREVALHSGRKTGYYAVVTYTCDPVEDTSDGFPEDGPGVSGVRYR